MCACFQITKVFQSTCVLKAHTPPDRGLVPTTPLREEETEAQSGKEGSGTEQEPVSSLHLVQPQEVTTLMSKDGRTTANPQISPG